MTCNKMCIGPQSNIVLSWPPVKIKVSNIYSNTVRETRKAYKDYPQGINTGKLKSVIPSFITLGKLLQLLLCFLIYKLRIINIYLNK